MKAYSALSSFYDRLMTDFNYTDTVGFILSEIELKGKNGLSIADGTGKISISLSLLGAKMTASDISEEMIREAMSNAKERGQNIIFTLGDLNDFEAFKTYDFIVSICDGLNYLHPKNRDIFFSEILKSLKPNGKFIFDISSSFKHREILKNNTFYSDEDDLAYIFSNNYDEKSKKTEMSVTLFSKEGELFRRYEDENTQYVHEKEEIEAIGKKTGFSVKTFDGTNFKEPENNSERLLFVFQRS